MYSITLNPKRPTTPCAVAPSGRPKLSTAGKLSLWHRPRIHDAASDLTCTPWGSPVQGLEDYCTWALDAIPAVSTRTSTGVRIQRSTIVADGSTRCNIQGVPKNCTKFMHHNFATVRHRVMRFSTKWSTNFSLTSTTVAIFTLRWAFCATECD